MMNNDYSLEKSPTLTGHTNKNGERGYYESWGIDIDGASIAYEYGRLNLTPEDVRRVVELAEESISDAIYDAIDRALDEYMGTR